MKVRKRGLTRKQRLARDGGILLACILFWFLSLGCPYLTPWGAFRGAEDRALLPHSAYAGSYSSGEETMADERIAFGVGEGEVHYAWLERRPPLFWDHWGAGVMPLDETLRAKTLFSGTRGYFLVRAGDWQGEAVAQPARLEQFYLVTTADPAVAAVEVTVSVTLSWLDEKEEAARTQVLSLTVGADRVGDGIWLARAVFSQGYEEAYRKLSPSFSGAQPLVRVTALDENGETLGETQAEA